MKGNNTYNNTIIDREPPKQTSKSKKKLGSVKSNPPSIDDVQKAIHEYCEKHNCTTEFRPHTFIDYYEANDWNKADGKPLKNWKQALNCTWLPKEVKYKTAVQTESDRQTEIDNALSIACTVAINQYGRDATDEQKLSMARNKLKSLDLTDDFFLDWLKKH